MSVAAILHSASAPPLGRGRSEADFQFASSEESGVVSSLLGTVLDGLPANYGELFTRHRITDDILGQLDEPDLQRMGIELVGHQKVIVNRIRRLAAQMAALESDVDPDSKPQLTAPAPNVLVLAWSGFVSAHFIRLGGMSKQEAFDLNNQLSTISALVWFASVTWITGKDGVFAFAHMYESGIGVGPLPGLETIEEIEEAHGWAFWPSYFAFQCSIVCSAISTFLGLHNNMMLLQVEDDKMGDYMAKYGVRQEQLMCFLFFVGLHLLIFAWLWMIFWSMPWPLNVIYITVPFSAIMLIWIVVTLPALKKIYMYDWLLKNKPVTFVKADKADEAPDEARKADAADAQADAGESIADSIAADTYVDAVEEEAELHL